jgi:protein-S-isoprenylcysteine O-methyltransferase Ste14
MTVLQYLILFTYSSTIGMLLLVASAYLRKLEGLWPPHSHAVLVVGWVWYVSTFVAALWLSFFEPPMHMLLNDISWKIVGWFLIVAGGVLIVWAFVAFRSFRRVSGEKIDLLITWGPYRYIRNPQYTSLMLFLSGITLIQNSLYFLPFAVMAVITCHMFTLLEERELEKIFGEKYAKYRQEVPRYLPRLKREKV